MSTPPVPIDARLYGAAQQLLLAKLAGTQLPIGEARGIVREQDAVDAVLMLFATIVEQEQVSRIDQPTAHQMVALLMVIRDYVRPLPPGLTEQGIDLLSNDLAEMVHALRITTRPAES